jgi:hypothetical protein
MKNQSLLSGPCRIAVRASLLGISLFAALSATAQNFVKNPDFEDPLGPDNWTVVYTNTFGGGANQPTNCGPWDFLVAGRTTIAHRDLDKTTGGDTWDGGWSWNGSGNYWSKFGAHFAPNHTWMMHAYFKQVVKGLTPGAYYTISAWMGFFGGNSTYLNKCNIYLEAVGLMGSKTTPYPDANVLNVQNNPAGWLCYAVTNRATSAGEIEVRLHFNKFGTTSTWEYRNFNAFYDHVAVMPQGQWENQGAYRPEYKILSCTRSNLDLTLTWQSVMNNRYRIQYTRDLSAPLASWPFVTWSPKVDTNLYATGAIYTFKTNLTCMFSFDPAFDPAAPLFFRIHQWGYEPYPDPTP